jgi:hypothetical protein
MSRHRRKNEEGAVAVIVSVSLILLFMLVALTVDLGFARADVRQNQSIADFSSLAGAASLETSYQAACQVAVGYVYANADELAAPPPAGVLALCAPFGTLDTTGCMATTTPVEVTVPAGPYTITLTSPVDDTDPAMTLEGQAVDPAVDGDRCERIKVGVTRDRDYLFAPVSGVFAGSPFADAVSRLVEGVVNENYASLVLLDRTRCQVLTVSGGASVTVNNYTGPSPEDPTVVLTYPGQIAIDTRANHTQGGLGGGSCTQDNAYAISISGSQSTNPNFVRAQGDIKSYGIHQGSSKIYDPALLTATASDGGPKLAPQPIGAARQLTRSPVDHLFNCLAQYRLTSNSWEPAQPIEGCPDAGSRPAYIKELASALQTTTPATYGVITGADCTGTRVINGAVDGRYWRIQCADSGPEVFNPTAMVFNDVEVVVSDNRIALGSFNSLVINGRVGHGAILYVRNGDITKGAQSSITISNTFTYLHNGTINIGAGAPVVTWRAPLGPGVVANCDGYLGTGLPPVGCFSPLAMWTNSSAEHFLGGQPPLNIAGTFFTPNAQPFNLSGQASQILNEAQFFTSRLELSGQGAITLVPNPSTNVPTPDYGTGLIR